MPVGQVTVVTVRAAVDAVRTAVGLRGTDGKFTLTTSCFTFKKSSFNARFNTYVCKNDKIAQMTK